MGEPYDAIVVGAGATGVWAAKELTAAGARVLLLDAGDRHDAPPGAPPDEASAARPGAGGAPAAASAERQPIQSRSPGFSPATAKYFVDDVDNPYVAPPDKPFEWFRIRGVGGRTLVGGRALLRFSDYEFKAASRDGFGADWPLSYRDLEPFYDRVEAELGVVGSREGLAHLPDGHYRALVELGPTALHLKRALEAEWPERRVIPGRVLVGEYRAVLAAAEQTGRLAVRPGAVVRRVLVEPDGARAAGVAFVDRHTREEVEASARVVVLCASTIESTRILLNSATRQHPAGLANSSGVLGRYLSDHLVASPALVLGAVEGHYEERPRPHPVIIPNFRNLGGGPAGFLRGYFFQCIGFDGGPEPAQPFSIQAFGEVLPRFENRVTVDPDRVDAWGVPVACIDFAYGDNERRMAEDQRETIAEMLRGVGIDTFEVNSEAAPPGYSLHEVGTARMGDDPATSVVDPFCQAWDVPNLFVTDGSCFVTAGHQNPTLTMMALTARACTRIVERLRDPGAALPRR
ncbi:MAG TPA: GMC family oxidoreductase [Polyangiaceae bacterium]|nr:GMC family oxidoreductase [Polyangiaceae bacterium]